jgi:hypothetical protein
MGTAEGGHGEDGHEHGYGPAPGNHDPSGVVPLGVSEHHIGDDTVAQKHQKSSSDEFAEKRIHEVFSLMSWLLRTALDGRVIFPLYGLDDRAPFR